MIRKTNALVLGCSFLVALSSCGSTFKKVDVEAVKEVVTNYVEAPNFVDNYYSADVWNTSNSNKSQNFNKVLTDLKKVFKKVANVHIELEELPEYRLSLEDIAEYQQLEEEVNYYVEGHEVTIVTTDKDNYVLSDDSSVIFPCTVYTSTSYDNMGFASSQDIEYNVTTGESEVLIFRYSATFRYSTTYTVTFDINGAPKDLNPAFGTGKLEDSVEPNTALVRPIAIPRYDENDSKRFKHWSLAKSGADAAVEYNFDELVNSSFTLYAIYE